MRSVVGSLIVARVVQLGGLVTVITLGGFMLVMFRRDSQQKNNQAGNGKAGTGTKVNG